MVERSAHNRLVAGSIPAGPTISRELEVLILAVPSQQELHRPILEMANSAQGGEVSFQQLFPVLIDRFSLDEKDLAETLSSGQGRFTNRVHWAVFYLRASGLLESPRRARFRITEDGRQILVSERGDIGVGLLKGRMAQRREHGFQGDPGTAVDTDNALTPDERIATIHKELNDKLADELLDIVGKVSPDSFERLVVRLLEKMGYGKGQAVGGSGDGGIDGIIDQDQLGLEKVYVQAKRWQSPIGAPEIFSFSGSLSARGASKGVFITTSAFGQNARQVATNISTGNQLIRLIDGEELAQLMIRYDVGVITETTYQIKKLDENYLSEEL